MWGFGGASPPPETLHLSVRPISSVCPSLGWEGSSPLPPRPPLHPGSETNSRLVKYTPPTVIRKHIGARDTSFSQHFLLLCVCVCVWCACGVVWCGVVWCVCVFFQWFSSISISYHRFSYYRGGRCSTGQLYYVHIILPGAWGIINRG